MLEDLNSHQISEWMAYGTIEPFGEHPKYLRAGIIAATIANAHRGKRTRAFHPEDFMPKEPKLPVSKTQSVEEQKNALQQIYAWAKKKRLTKEKDKRK